MILLQLLVSLGLSFILIKFIVKYASKLGMLDIPNGRSSHCSIVPRGAGIGFISSLFISFIVFEYNLFIENWYIFLSISLIFAIGILDDHKDAPPKAKFIIMFIASIILYFYDVGIFSLGSYFGYELSLWYIALPFTIFSIAGFTNALNLIDGLDGLSASITIVILMTFGYIGYIFQDELIFKMCLFTIVVLISFLFLNWNPAKIFMGDSGSLTLGFIIAVVAILSLKYIHPVTILYLTAIPILDTLIVMVRRIRRGKSPFHPDKTHIHHILLNFFGDVKKAVVFLALMQIMFCFLGYVVARHIEMHPNGLFPMAMIIAFGIIFVLTYMTFTAMKKRQKLIDSFTNK